MQYISIGLTIAFAVFLGLGFLLGLKRGFKRTLVRGMWLTAVVLFVLIFSMNITEILLTIKFNFTYAGQVCPTIKDYLVAFLKDKIVVDGGNYEAVVNIGLAVISLVVNSVIFLVLYWVLKIVTLILYYFFNIFIFHGERKRKRQAKKEKKKIKIKKYRFAGGLVGLVFGFVSFCLTITPVVGYISIAKNVEGHSAVKNDGKGLLTEYAGKTYTDIIDVYDNSVPMKVINTLSIDKVLNSLFDNISSVKINNEKVVLSNEAIAFVDIYDSVKGLKVPDLNTTTKEELSKLLNDVEVVNEKVFDSKIISASADAVIPFVAKYVRQQINTSNFKPYVLEFYNAFFDQFEGLNSLSTEKEISQAIGVIKTLNNNNLLLPIVQNTTGDIGEYLKNNLTKPVADELINGVFALSTVNSLAPSMVNFLLGYGAYELGYEYNKETAVTANALKTGASVIINSAIDLLQTYDKDKVAKVDINKSTLGAFGSMLDEVKELVSQENFKSIVNSIEPKLEKMALESLSSTPQFLKNTVSKMVMNISEISNFNEEFTSLYSAFDVIKNEFNNSKVESNYDVELMDFSKLGKSLNTFQVSQLLRDDLFLNTMSNAIKYYLEVAEKNVNGNKAFAFTFDEVVLENIEDLKTTGINWETELPTYKHTAGIVANLLQDKENVINRLKSKTDTTIEELGYEFEHNLTDSVLFRGADRLLVADMLELADIKINTTQDASLKANTSTLLMDAKDNVLNTPDINWEREFKHIKSIITVDFENSSDENILQLADVIDGVVFDSSSLNKSTIFTQDMFNQFIANYMDTIFGTVDEEDDFYNTLNRIKTSFRNETIISYHNEFEALLKLKETKDLIGSGFNFKLNGVQLGRKLDESLAIGDNKVVVTKSLVNDFIVKKVDEYFNSYSSDLEKEIDIIKNGFNDDIQLYEVEMSALVRLMNVADSVKDGFEFNNKSQATALGAQIDLSLSVVTVNTIDYSSTIVDRNLINGYLKRVINDKVDLSDSKEFSEVITKITGTKSGDSYNTGRIDTFTNTYEKEFGYLSQLTIVSDNFKDITISTIGNKNNTLNSTLAEQFDGNSTITDPLKNSQLVGDALMQAIGSALTTYKNDSSNAKFGEVLIEVDKNYTAIKSQINWTLNKAGEVSYTQVINALTGINNELNSSLTNEITDVSEVSANANTYNNKLANLQTNLLLSYNGTNRLAKYIMEQVVLVKLNENSSLFANAITYANNYIDYLDKSVNNQQPYNETTDVVMYKVGENWVLTQPTNGEIVSIQVNKPFTVIGELITIANASA